MTRDALWALIGLAGGIAAAVPLAMHWAATRRREALREAALRLGFEFAPDAAPFAADLAGLRIVTHGRAHRLANALHGRRGDVAVEIADHRYVTGSGKNSHRHRASLVVMRTPRLALPHFFMRPQIAVVDRIGRLLGGKDVDFPEDDGFSDAFVLQGDDEGAVRALFAAAARQQALRLGRGVRVEGRGDVLLVERGRAVRADDAAMLLEAATGFFEVIASGPSARW
jgi:hypothetical protein